jgi:hypothetical protein
MDRQRKGKDDMPMIDVYADSTLFAKESHGDVRRTETAVAGL